MKYYRLTIYHKNIVLGHFDSDIQASTEAIKQIAEKFCESDGYRLALQVASEENRVIESGPGGIRVISREPLFKSVSLGSLR